MPAERAGYTVTLFLIDVSQSMGKSRVIELPEDNTGEIGTLKLTNLEWSLQFVMLKIQEMIYNGRKTDQCGVILFGSEETNNIINEANGGYESVQEYIPIGQPNAGTLAKLATLQSSTVSGDPIDALIVGIETQAQYLASKKTWTRKIVLLTDGENDIEKEDWEVTAKKMNSLDIGFTIVGVDFDDDELPFHEEDKSEMKRLNEIFYHTFVSRLNTGIVGNCAFALQEVSRPDVRQTKSALLGTVLRLGDVEARPEEAIEISVKTSKCTALARPKSWKRFALRTRKNRGVIVDEEADANGKIAFLQLQMRSEYYVDPNAKDEDDSMEVDEEPTPIERLQKLEKEELVRGFKYGTTYVPCPDGAFPRLHTRKGIDICGFFMAKGFRRELAMSEVQYIWADPSSLREQVALSSIVQAMYVKGAMAICRWVSRDGADPKMGVLSPCVFDNVDCFLWVQMPFADDVRKYNFASLDTLISKKGEVITKHPYLPTEAQLEAMENFVDALDLMDAGEKDEEGDRTPWYDTRLSYNPAVHRTKQALFHSAIVPDLSTHPLPPPHPELQKYFDPPRKVLKRARDVIEDCIVAFNVKEVPAKVAKTRKDEHVHAQDDDENMILLDKMPRNTQLSRKATTTMTLASSQAAERFNKARATQSKGNDSGSDTEPESDEEEETLLDTKPPSKLPVQEPLSPARSPSVEPDPGRAPGRIIGTTYPLKDFQNNLARGDVVTKAVTDLANVVIEIVMQPFSSRRTDELLNCVRALRKTALEEDEIETYNEFMQDLRTSCLADNPGNQEFWGHIRALGRNISLISDKEATKAGGLSNVSEAAAEEFVQ